MSRQLRSTLPVTAVHLNPKVSQQSNVRQKMLNTQNKSKSNYDKHTKPLMQLNIGEPIRIRQGKVWKPAIVINKVNDRSYQVKTQSGAIYRRNRNHLLKSYENPSIINHEQSAQNNTNTPAHVSQNQTSPVQSNNHSLLEEFKQNHGN